MCNNIFYFLFSIFFYFLSFMYVHVYIFLSYRRATRFYPIPRRRARARAPAGVDAAAARRAALPLFVMPCRHRRTADCCGIDFARAWCCSCSRKARWLLSPPPARAIGVLVFCTTALVYYSDDRRRRAFSCRTCHIDGLSPSPYICHVLMPWSYTNTTCCGFIHAAAATAGARWCCIAWLFYWCMMMMLRWCCCCCMVYMPHRHTCRACLPPACCHIMFFCFIRLYIPLPYRALFQNTCC